MEDSDGPIGTDEIQVASTSGIDDWFRVDLDSHADTCCVGNGVLIVNQTERTARVSPFLKSLGSVNKVPIVTAAIAYDDPKSGEVFVLLIHQALYFEELRNCLLCPMQLRLNDVVINERPKFLTAAPTEKDHAIMLEDLIIPLDLHGVTSFFHGRTPTMAEYESCKRIELTYPDPTWRPHDPTFADEEALRNNADNEDIQVLAVLDEEHFSRDIYEQFGVSALKSDNPRYKLTPEVLATTWGIGLSIAKQTLAATTQRAVKTVVSPSIERRWPTGDRPLRYRKLHHQVFHDNMKSKTKSLRGNTCCEIYATDFGWSRAFPLQKESDVHESLDLFLGRYGIPEALVSDNAKSYIGGTFRKKAREAGIFCKLTDPHSPWQNRAEGEIREIKRLAGRWLVKSKSPRRLWDHCIELASLVRSHMALDMYKLQGQVPETVMMGQTADISFLCQFKWYEWIYYNDTAVQFPDQKVILGRYLGPTEPEVGSVLTAKILTKSGEIIRRNTLRSLTEQEVNCDDNRKERDSFDEKVGQRLGEPFKEPELESSFDVSVTTPEYEVYDDDEETKPNALPEIDKLVGSHEEYDPEGYNGYITAEVLLPKGDEFRVGTVKKRKADDNGTPIGKSHDNPILDTREYQVEFDDGDVLEYSANVIAENLYSSVDSEGRRHVILDSIIDHKADASAMEKADAFTELKGKRIRQMTTQGWKMCVQWKDGTTSWALLKDLKESNPVQVAEYAVANGIAEEPAFAWWVPYTLKKKLQIIAKVKTRYFLRSHKFGIELPKSVQDALNIDRETNTTYWQDAIALEIKNVDVAFQDLEENEKVPVGYQQIKCHMIFDVKVGSLQRKARYVAGGHMTEAPAAVTYASVVGRESIRLGLMLAALNGLTVLSADIQNAYLTSPCSEKIYTVLGPEFGPHRQGKRSLVVRALYGLKSAGASFRNHLASCLSHLGYQSSRGDPDVWFCAATKENKEEYYEYLLVYTDDILAIGMKPMDVLTKLNKYFKLKAESVHSPDNYLGTKLKETILPNGAKAWGQSSSQYVQNAVKNLETWMADKEYKLPKKAPTPMIATYRPEMDVTALLNADEANYYQSLVGVLRWIIEVGRIDITTEVSMLAAHMAMPRVGHLYAVFRVFAYLKAKHNSRMIFDPTYPTINHHKFKADEDWTSFYGNVKEAIPPNAPKPRGKPVVLRCFVDSDHAGNLVTRRSRTGYIQMVNMSIVHWLSKKQGSVEGSTFGSEFVAAKAATEANRALRYKLRMMGVPIDGPTYMYCDNMSVVNNTTAPQSVLKKKSNSIAYHAVREAVAMGELLIAYIKTNENLADVMTKALPGGEKRDALIQSMLWDIC
jgi:Reverse transcriptase (RNA-dependent DNA polymerase)